MNEDCVCISKLEKLPRKSSFRNLFSEQHCSEVYPLLEKALDTCLPRATILPWQDNFSAWWKSPVIRLGRACLVICEASASKMGCNPGSPLPKTLGPLFIKWVCLLVEPIVRTGDEAQYEPQILETFVTLLTSAANDVADLDMARLPKSFPRIVHTVVSLAIAASATERHGDSPDASDFYRQLYHLFSSLITSTLVRNDKVPIWTALEERPVAVADAIIRTMNWMVGTSAGKHSQPIRDCIHSLAGCLTFFTWIAPLRTALIQRGFVPMLSLTLRKVVRGEVEKLDSIGMTLWVALTLLDDLTQHPAQMREALDAHLISSLLRIPDMLVYATKPKVVRGGDKLAIGLPQRLLAFMSRVATFTIFPSLRSSMRKSVKRTDTIIERGDISFCGELGAALKKKYSALHDEFDFHGPKEDPFFVPMCCNTQCASTRIVGECPSCQTVVYCSLACQREHWKHSHKDECNFRNNEMANCKHFCHRITSDMR